MKPKLAVAIIHAAHIPERVPLMDRLRESLGVASLAIPGAPEVVAYHEETTRGPWWIWLEMALRFFEESKARGVTHCLTLQDDVIPCATFWPTLLALIEGRPDQVLCLDCAHPAARQIFLDGQPGYTTPDGMIGIAHVEPIAVALDFARWRLTEVRDDARKRFGEDIQLGSFCMDRHLPIFAPVPCMVDHDLSITSTNEGYDDHWYRKPQVTTRELERLTPEDAGVRRANMLDPKWWAREAPHVGRFYDHVNHLQIMLKDTKHARELVDEYDEDKTPEKYKRFWMRLQGTE